MDVGSSMSDRGSQGVAGHDGQQFASGMTVLARGEQWLVTDSRRIDHDVTRLSVIGTSSLVRDQSAVFFHARGLDNVVPLLPEETRLVTDDDDDSPAYRRSRLFIEALLRKTPLPQGERRLATVGTHLADDLSYQREPAMLAFASLRPRLLIADAVGLGKTLEIGLLLSELIRRGRGDRILVVVPRHILEQFQHELWTRFAIPLIAVDSSGIARMQQSLPAGRNPFDYYKRVIASIDTIKSDRYREQLKRVEWDAVVMDESHNLISRTSYNNQLARVLAPQSHAFILASATPHNGNDESFNELISLIDPTAIVDLKKRATPEELAGLFVRRHKMTPDVAAQIGDQWKEREEPIFLEASATAEEEAVFAELYATWVGLPEGQTAPVTGEGSGLFPVGLLKAFLSSHRALAATLDARIKQIDKETESGTTKSGKPARNRSVEHAALMRLRKATAMIDPPLPGDEPRPEPAQPAKLATLLAVLEEIDVAPGSGKRVVVFSERLDTIFWLREQLYALTKFKKPAAKEHVDPVTGGPIRVLHGGQSDDDVQQIVKEFALESSDLRILLTSDVASEGVNLHRQCNQLVHYDIPWSLITIQQRNGRIDRYGQLHAPQMRFLLLKSPVTRFRGTDDNGEPVELVQADALVSKKLAGKEHTAHRTLGDAASLMGLRDEGLETQKIMEAVGQAIPIDDVVPDQPAAEFDPFMAGVTFDEPETSGDPVSAVPPTDALEQPHLFPSLREFVVDAFAEIYPDPKHALGFAWLDAQDYPDTFRFELNKRGSELRDLQRRLKVLPQTYLAERQVMESLTLTFSPALASRRLDLARKNSGAKPKRTTAATKEEKFSESGWPDISFMTDQHPVTDWLVDKMLSRMPLNSAPVLAASVTEPVFLLHGRFSNGTGKPTVSEWLAISGLPATPRADAREFVEVLRAADVNAAMVPRAVGDLSALQGLVRHAVEFARAEMRVRREAADSRLLEPLTAYQARLSRWERANMRNFEQVTLGGVHVRRSKDRVERTATAVRKLIDELATDRDDPLIRLVAVLTPGETS